MICVPFRNIEAIAGVMTVKTGDGGIDTGRRSDCVVHIQAGPGRGDCVAMTDFTGSRGSPGSMARRDGDISAVGSSLRVTG